MRYDQRTAEKLAPLLKEAVASEIRVLQIVAEIERMLAGETCPEGRRQYVENRVHQAVLDGACDSETAEGYGVEDAVLFLEDLDENGFDPDPEARS